MRNYQSMNNTLILIQPNTRIATAPHCYAVASIKQHTQRKHFVSINDIIVRMNGIRKCTECVLRCFADLDLATTVEQQNTRKMCGRKKKKKNSRRLKYK